METATHNDPDGLIDLATAARILNIPYRGLVEDVHAGLLPALITGKQRKTIRVNLPQLRQAIAARIQANVKPPPNADYTRLRWTEERRNKIALIRSA